MIIIEAAAIAAAFYLLIALGLVASQRPSNAAPEAGAGLDFRGVTASDLGGLPEPSAFAARDGATLHYRRYDSAAPCGRVIVLVHGSSWHGMQFNAMAKRLAENGLGTVIVPDLRGHGADPARRGDVDHIGQLEEDVADLIDHVGAQMPGSQIVLGGHSSGGGFVVRFAGGAYGDRADAFILMAPFLRHDAPTTRVNAGGWARPAVRRIIGLAMLNAVGIRLFNHLAVIGFAMPRAVLDGPYGKTATTAYSYRLNVSFAPRRDYGADLARIGDRPLLVLAGSKDESFFAEKYEPVIAAHVPGGSYHVLDGVGHLGIVDDPGAIGIVADWIAALPAKD